MKVLQYSLEEFGICDVRCASFHPTEPILACGLTDGRIVLLKGSDHSTPFSQWVFDYILPVGVHKVTIAWNVSLNNLVPLNGSDEKKSKIHENPLIAWLGFCSFYFVT